MKLIEAIVLCGIVAVTYAKDQCSCDSLKQCVEEQKAAMKATFQACGQMCYAELGEVAAQVKTCFENITARMVQFEQSKGSCMFDPANNLCGSARVKRDFMFRKHHEGNSGESDDEEGDHEETDEWKDRESKHRRRQDKEHKKHESSSESSNDHERDKSESDEWNNHKHHEKKHGKHGGHGKHGDHGKCDHKRHDQENLLHMKMKPYHECMQQCFRAKHPMPEEHHKEHHKEWKMEESRSHEAKHERRHHRRGHHPGGWWMKKCERQLNCTINKEAMMATMESCHAKSGMTKANAFEFKLQSCECLRNAFKIEPWQSPCAPSKEEGFHHHWNGGDKNVHRGSHFY